MPATSVREFLWLVGGHLSDLTPQFGYWSEIELVNYTMDGQAAIAALVPQSVSRVNAFKLKPGTRQNLATVAVGDCRLSDGTANTAPVEVRLLLNPRRNMGADGLTPGDAIRLVERDQKDLATPKWHSKTGLPVREVVYDPMTPREFYVWPGIPAGQTWWAELAVVASPDVIPNTGGLYAYAGTNSTKLSIDDEYRAPLMHYVCARALLKETKAADRGKFAVHEQLALNYLNTKIATITGSNPNLTALPGLNPPPKG